MKKYYKLIIRNFGETIEIEEPTALKIISTIEEKGGKGFVMLKDEGIHFNVVDYVGIYPNYDQNRYIENNERSRKLLGLPCSTKFIGIPKKEKCYFCGQENTNDHCSVCEDGAGDLVKVPCHTECKRLHVKE